MNQPLHSNSDKDIFVLNIRFSAIMSVLQISCSLIVSRKEKKKKKKKKKEQVRNQCTTNPLYFAPFFPPPFLFDTKMNIPFLFLSSFLRIELFFVVSIPYSRMTRFCSSFFYQLLIRKIEIASFPFSLVKCFFSFFYLTTIRFHFLTRFEDKCSRMLFL